MDALERGRAAFAQEVWSDAYSHLSAAERDAKLDPEDLERLATAAYLVGEDRDSADRWARAHQEFLSRGDVERAVRCAFWLAFGLLNQGARARGGAWVARGQRILDENRRECVERGYLLLPVALQAIAEGDVRGAHAHFSRAAETGERYGDPDLLALARHGRGRVLLRMGKIHEGVSLLDAAMVAVDAGEVSPLVVGDVYCSVIEGCFEIYDLRRAHEWTTALTRWCESHPDLVPYSGQCLVRRAEILQLHGQWPEAVEAAERARERFLRGSHQPAAGSAFYQQAELHRLHGELGEAEEAYRRASQRGRKPQPGLALLQLAQGRLKAARAAISRALDATSDRASRSRLLPAYVEILLAANDVEAARGAADELGRTAEEVDAELLHAAAAQARGAVLLAEGDARTALAELDRAGTIWAAIEAPYDAARARVLVGLAWRALDDENAAQLELDAARWVFQELQARVDLARLDSLTRPAAGSAPKGLTRREVEVLRLVASGKTNRAVAAQLSISERTVERHLSNIFAKLEVSSRAAATAFAYEHEII